MRLFGRGRPEPFRQSTRELVVSYKNPGTLKGGWVAPGLLVMFLTLVTVVSCTTTDPTTTPTSVPEETVTVLPSPTATEQITPTTEPSPTATTEPTSTPTVPPSPTPDVPSALTPTETPTTAPATPTSTPIPQPAELFVEVLSPVNQSTVDGSELHVTGRTNPDATVSVNGQLAVVDISGSFEAALMLMEGPNLIEVIASDLTGEVRSQVLVVVYLP